MEVTDDGLGKAMNKTVEYTIDVRVAEIKGIAPSISTPDRHRVVQDPIGKNGNGEADIKAYLLAQPVVTPGDTKIVKKTLISAVKVKGPDANKLDTIDVNDPEQLKQMLHTVGEYEVEIEVKDENNNIVRGIQKWKVAGESEFGILDENDKFQALKETFDVRQHAGEKFTTTGLRVRHQDPDGSYHVMAIAETVGNLSLDNVEAKDITLKAVHHYANYEDDASLPRALDSYTFKLLVQGEIKFSGLDDLYVRRNTQFDPKTGVKATFKMVDKDNHITEETADVTVSEASSENIGAFVLHYTAIDHKTQASFNQISAQRNLYVSSLPDIQYIQSFTVKKNATKNDIKNALQLSTVYTDHHQEIKNISEGDIHYDFDKVDTSKAGEWQTLTITVDYEDNHEVKKITRTAKIFIKTPPVIKDSNDEFNVGDTFDPLQGIVIQDPDIAKEQGADKGILVLTKEHIKENTVDTSQAGTYHVVYAVSDGYNDVELERIVKVNGLPEIHGIKDFTTRIHQDFDAFDGVSATYLKAQDTIGEKPVETKIAITKKRSNAGSFQITEYRNQKGEAIGTPFDKEGLYTAVYEAVTPTYGKQAATANVYVHGVPEIAIKDFAIRRKEKDAAQKIDVDLLKNAAHLKATVQVTQKDGSVKLMDITDLVKIDDQKLDQSREGVYTLYLQVSDQLKPAMETKKEVNVTVIDQMDEVVISGNDKVVVIEGMSEADIKEKINASAHVINNKGELVDLTKDIVYDFHDYNPDVSGTYHISVSVTWNGQTVVKDFSIYVDEKPVVKSEDVTIREGETFDPLAGIQATDKEDGTIRISEAMIIRNTVDIFKPGEYSVLYEISDSAGNRVRVERKVSVKAKPVITIDDGTDKKEQETIIDRIIESVQTGDTTNVVLWGSLLVLAGVAAIGSMVAKRKKEKN